jgi:uncharacterized protein (DUF2141 family)
MKRLTYAILLLGAFLGRPADAEAADLTVTVEGLRSDKGHVSFGLYDQPGRFPTREGVIATGSAKADGRRAVYVFHDLTPGRYAVSVFHDENDNGKFDRSMIGLPLEGYGFSNDAKVRLSPPSFDEAIFMVGEAGASIIINIVY